MAECYLCCQDSSNKLDKPAAANNVALLDSTGNIIDSGKQLTPAGILAMPENAGLYDFLDIPANSDLNNYTACGYYKYSYDEATFSLVNAPAEAAFTLQVINGYGYLDHDVITESGQNYRIQLLTTWKGDKYVRYIYKSSSNVEFSGWSKLLSDNDWPSLKSEITLSSLGAQSLISRGAYFGNLNFVENSPGTLYDNSVVWFGTSSGTTNAPIDGSGYCMTWSNGGGYVQQLVYIDGSQYTRMYYNGGDGDKWHDWVPSNNYVVNNKDTSDKIYISYNGTGTTSLDLKALAGFDTAGNISNTANGSAAALIYDYLGFASAGEGIAVQNDPVNIQYRLSCIKFGYWTPVIEGVSSHAYQTGWYLTIGSTCVIGWYAYGSFAGSTTSRFKITGCPFTPLQVSGGGGGCSGYTSASNIIFTGYELQKNASIYAVGQETSTSSPNRWQSNSIYQKASGDTSSYGTIAFKITPVSD